MKNVPWLLFLSVVLFCGAHVPSASAATPRLWLGGVDPVVQREKKRLPAPNDYMDMFRPEAPWSVAASRLTVFKTSMQFGLRSTDEELNSLINGLQHRHISLAFDVGMLVGTERCGMGVEGYASPAGIETLARRVKQHGGTIDYIAMDEPVWFGHAQSGSGHCRDSIVDLVTQIAPKIATLRRYFPKIQIGDIEPVNSSRYGLSQDPNFIADVISFADALQRETGTKLAFVDADVIWTWPWQPLLETLARQLRARGIRLGVICDGDPNAGSDEVWVVQALQHCRTAAANPKTAPDDLIVQSWERLPAKMLPETAPATLTYEARELSSSHQRP